MKFIHTADLHLGKQFYGYNILADQAFILRRIAQLAVSENADGILLAGDIFDTPVAGRAAVDLLNKFLTYLQRSNITVFMISGNHDSPERIHYGSSIMDNCGIYINGIYDSERDVRVIDLSDEFGPLHLCLLPYIDPAMVRSSGKFGDITVTTFDEAVAAVIASIPLKSGERYAVVAHQFVAGFGTMPASSESERITVGGIEQVDAKHFAEFEYAALGHLHKPQKVGLATIRYAGSPLKYSPSECGPAKSVTVVEFFEKGNVTIRQIPLKPLRDLRIICGTVDDLTTAGAVPMPHDDFFFVQLTDPLPPADTMARLRAKYPAVIGVERVNDSTPAAVAAGARMEDLQKSDRDLFAGFFSEVSGRPMTALQETVVQEILQEMGGEK
ncbi:exonuclease SbcCD subunit D [Methanorbis furvi]|uniref:Nuclease SbcCD subunit D n=1 Tax=Methanorbis furvi TaxID=3028299 RepID=A0AAE4MDA4_9EURY|nr:Nuclease SbcCD subunit D [Methanocorpusculaceae archaeon Ag1]